MQQPLATGEGGRGMRQTVDDSLGQLINPPWWNNDEVYMNHSRTISDTKSWLTSAGYRHVIRNPSGLIWMDLVMSNHFGHHLRRHLIKLHHRHNPIRPKSCPSNVESESWYFGLFGRHLQCCSERAQSGVIWVDLVMSSHFMYRLRRHLMKLHCR